VDDATEATSTTDGSLQTDGGLSVAKSAVIGDDLDLLSNAAIFKVGSDQPFTLTHANANNTLLASQNHRLAFGAAGEYISGDGTDLKIVSSGDVDITGTTDVVGGLSSTQATVLAQTAGTTTIGSSNAAVFSADGKLNINSTTDASDATDGSLQTDGGLSVAKKIFAGDNISLGKNSGVLTLGQDQQFQITHANANSTAIVGQDDRLAFGQAAKYIVGDGTDMEIVSDGLIKLSADVSGSGTLDIKGQATLGNSRFVVNENLALLAAPLAVSGTFAIEEAMSSAKLQTDGMLYFDSGSGEVRRSSLVDVAASMAGTGVTATNGVFSVDTTGGDSMSSTLIPADAYGNAALTVGLNYMV
ncbi:MAG: hypothetical protein VXX33_10625, partial [Pseudomonadota bacterium]|nr:hypothetical protein [Pseudomonadota bacterium]